MKYTVQTEEDQKPEKKAKCPICGQTLFFISKGTVQVKCTRCTQIILVESEDAQ